MGVAIAQYLRVVQSPAVSNENEQIPQRPARVVCVCGGVGEANEAVLGVHVVEEALLVGAQLPNHPPVAYVFHWRDWRLWCVVDLATAANALCDEEASLSDVVAVLERLHCIDQVRGLAWTQLARLADLLPMWIGLYGGEAEVVCELVLLQVGEDDGGEGGEEGGALVYRAVVDGVPYLQASVWNRRGRGQGVLSGRIARARQGGRGSCSPRWCCSS